MDMTHWHYLGALVGMIGIGWLVVALMYRGWKPLNDRMSERVKESTTLLAALEEADPCHAGSHPSRTYGISIR
ncbi:hypothetical protein C7T35_27040 [Variovorax sp. WS11]|uniref:hypothetical protein n=1 Tax=Variovorax sp. WS11 TaxID=1105204 RepID=UPI000D0C9C4D|nr:hypothetical protein [Variovorax sp. WS11]NDZ15975.1 hypothetical protein [Variovorax sp. WS11]PSL81418.1 hypothetical protein C7T35_27040 [Variovorax sp. WS11]